MRVLQLIDSLDAGGAERMSVTFANALSHKIDASFLCATRKEGILRETLEKKVGYLFLKKNHALDLKAIIRLYRFIKKNEVNILHAHSSSYFTATILKLLKPKIILVWHDHYGKSENIEERKYKIIRWCSQWFGAIISVNLNLKKWAEKNLKTEKVVFLQNTVFIPFSSRKTNVLNGIDGKRIICLANLRPQKDHKNLLNAFKLVVQKYPDYSLHLFGKNWNDNYFKDVLSFIDSENLNQSVFYYGPCKDVYEVLKESTIGVLSSNSEGLPVTLLEYGFVGLPVVCTKVGQCEEVLKGHGKCVEPFDAHKLAHSIIYYIEHRNEMEIDAKSFQDHVKSNYSVDVIIPKLISLYESCSKK